MINWVGILIFILFFNRFIKKLVKVDKNAKKTF